MELLISSIILFPFKINGEKNNMEQSGWDHSNLKENRDLIRVRRMFHSVGRYFILARGTVNRDSLYHACKPCKKCTIGCISIFYRQKKQSTFVSHLAAIMRRFIFEWVPIAKHKTHLFTVAFAIAFITQRKALGGVCTVT